MLNKYRLPPAWRPIPPHFSTLSLSKDDQRRVNVPGGVAWGRDQLARVDPRGVPAAAMAAAAAAAAPGAAAAGRFNVEQAVSATAESTMVKTVEEALALARAYEAAAVPRVANTSPGEHSKAHANGNANADANVAAVVAEAAKLAEEAAAAAAVARSKQAAAEAAVARVTGPQATVSQAMAASAVWSKVAEELLYISYIFFVIFLFFNFFFFF